MSVEGLMLDLGLDVDKKLNRWEFETVVETAAAKIVNEDSMQFYFGTLFVKCTSYEAAKIETVLNETLKCGVIVSKVGPEYCFDFVGE